MIKKIIQELEQKFGEKFSAEISKNKAEIFSENHLYEYNLKTGQLKQLF